MKKLCEYKFTNNKTIRVYYAPNKEVKELGMNKYDNFILGFKTRKEETQMGLRGDEMVQVITLLGYALYVGLGDRLLKNYNGFWFNKLPGKNRGKLKKEN